MDDYFDNLSKWQAMSDPPFADMSPSDLFNSDFASLYDNLHRLLWDRVTRVHGTIVTLEQIGSFPFEFINGPDDMSFWHLVVNNFKDSICIHLSSLTDDSGSDAHSIPRFKNQIMSTDWLDSEKKVIFAKMLKKRRFDDEVENIKNRMKEIRDHRVAHQLVDVKSGTLKGVMSGISQDELRKLLEAMLNIFGAVSIGSAFVTLDRDLVPSTVGGQRRLTCLDTVLNAVIKESYFVNEPEKYPLRYYARAVKEDAETTRIRNWLRSRVDLAPVYPVRSGNPSSS